MGNNWQKFFLHTVVFDCFKTILIGGGKQTDQLKVSKFETILFC